MPIKTYPITSIEASLSDRGITYHHEFDNGDKIGYITSLVIKDDERFIRKAWDAIPLIPFVRVDYNAECKQWIFSIGHVDGVTPDGKRFNRLDDIDNHDGIRFYPPVTLFKTDDNTSLYSVIQEIRRQIKQSDKYGIYPADETPPSWHFMVGIDEWERG